MEHATTQPKQAAAAGGKEQQPLSKLEEEQKAKELSKPGKECSVTTPHVCQHAGGTHHAGHIEGQHAGHDAAWHEAHKAEHETQVGTKAGAKVGEEHKAPEMGKTTTAAPSTRRRGAIEKKARQPDAPVEVLDCMERELFQLSPEDVQKHDVKWLKQQILAKKNMELKSGEELLIYTKFEQWLKDDEPLSKALGDRPSVNFFRHVPHSGPFQVNLKKEGDEKPLSVTAKDGESILRLKQRIAEEHRIPAAHQRLFFMGVLLDDSHTVNDYKLPAECTLELDVVSV